MEKKELYAGKEGMCVLGFFYYLRNAKSGLALLGDIPAVSKLILL